MTRKLSLLMMLVVVASVIMGPGSASAVGVTSKAGTLAPVGTVLTFETGAMALKTSLGTLICESATLQAELTANGASEVRAVESGPAGGTTCYFKGTTPIPLTNFTLHSLESTVTGAGVMQISATADFPGGISCHFESNAGGTPFSYVAGTDALHITSSLKSSPQVCGAGPTYEVEPTVTISGTPVIWD